MVSNSLENCTFEAKQTKHEQTKEQHRENYIDSGGILSHGSVALTVTARIIFSAHRTCSQPADSCTD